MYIYTRLPNTLLLCCRTKQSAHSYINHPHPQTLYAYSGQYSDELSFPAGVTMTLVKRIDAEWWEGRVNGAAVSLVSEKTYRSLFPEHCLQLSKACLRTYSGESITVIGSGSVL